MLKVVSVAVTKILTFPKTLPSCGRGRAGVSAGDRNCAESCLFSEVVSCHGTSATSRTTAAASASCASTGPSEPTAPSRAQYVARCIAVEGSEAEIPLEH